MTQPSREELLPLSTDDLHPERATLRMIVADLRGCVAALGEGDDLGAVLSGYADAAEAVLKRTAVPSTNSNGAEKTEGSQSVYCYAHQGPVQLENGNCPLCSVSSSTHQSEGGE